MSDGKREIIARLIEEYDIRSAEDIQNALRDLLGRTIQGMMEGEMETQKKEKQEEDPAYTDSRNGYKTKTLRSNYGPVEVNVPQDRKSDYDPKIVPKYGRDISEIDEKIIRMYARGMTTRQISDQIMEIYGFEVSEAMVTSVTNKILPEIEEWQKRPLSAVYPIVYIDAIVFNVRSEGIIRKHAAYVILGVSEEGHKEVLSITVGDNESAKFWLSVLNELKNRGVRDIFVLCADGLSGISEAISASHAKSPSRTGFNRSCRCSCFSIAVRGFFICAPQPVFQAERPLRISHREYAPVARESKSCEGSWEQGWLLS